jgi:mannose-1-phosphate guanylyltransferase
LKAILFAAGEGKRLLPLTREWPKCLMPIGERPLLEYWLHYLTNTAVNEVYINLHSHSEIVESFLNQERFNSVKKIYEGKLLGTGGTLIENYDYLKDNCVLAIHADNWSVFNIDEFINYHNKERPKGTLITMMTFEADNPELSGIVELDKSGIVTQFHEKVENPPSNLANAAVFIIEPYVLDWMTKNNHIDDFSRDVIPNFLGRIATWKNNEIHRDIGTINALKKAQLDPKPILYNDGGIWQQEFDNNPIKELLKKA